MFVKYRMTHISIGHSKTFPKSLGTAQGFALPLRAAADTLNRFDELATPINFTEIVPVNCPLTNTVLIECALHESHKS